MSKKEKKTDPRLVAILKRVGRITSAALDEAVLEAAQKGLDLCEVYDALSHTMAQKVGHIDILHVESDMRTKDPKASITRDELVNIMTISQTNAIHSMTLGVNEALKSGGHYTVDELEADLQKDLAKVSSKPKKDGDGGTFH
jgi:hypothetical protein